MTLTDFLLARIAADEVMAWRGGDHNGGGTFANDNYGCLLVQPARVLAECEAKRRIVEREGARLHAEWRRLSDEHRLTFDEWFTKPRGETLRDLATVYADHPDFDEGWRA